MERCNGLTTPTHAHNVFPSSPFQDYVNVLVFCCLVESGVGLKPIYLQYFPEVTGVVDNGNLSGVM